MDSALPPDVLERVFSCLAAQDLGRAACTCRSWRSAALSEVFWKAAFRAEFGDPSTYLSPASESATTTSTSWHKTFLSTTSSSHRPYLALAARFACALDNHLAWRVTISQVPSAVVVHQQGGGGYLQVDGGEFQSYWHFSGTIRSRGVQSLCVQFDIPLSVWKFGSGTEYSVLVEGLAQRPVVARKVPGESTSWGVSSDEGTGLWYAAIEEKAFGALSNESLKLMQAHTTGLYDHICEDGHPQEWSSPPAGFRVSSSGDSHPRAPEQSHPPSSSSPMRCVRLLAYMHSEQLLPRFPFPLPQSLPLTTALNNSRRNKHPQYRSPEPSRQERVPSGSSSHCSAVNEELGRMDLDFGSGADRLACNGSQQSGEKGAGTTITPAGKGRSLKGGSRAAEEVPRELQPLLQLLKGPLRGYLDFVTVHGVVEGSCWVDLYVLPHKATQQIEEVRWRSRGGVHTSVGSSLLSLADAEAMADITLFNSSGKLLMGRAGVEIWRTEDPSPQFDLQFIPEDYLEQSLPGLTWANSIALRPMALFSEERAVALQERFGVGESLLECFEQEEDEIGLVLSWEAAASMARVADTALGLLVSHKVRTKLLKYAAK